MVAHPDPTPCLQPAGGGRCLAVGVNLNVYDPPPVRAANEEVGGGGGCPSPICAYSLPPSHLAFHLTPPPAAKRVGSAPSHVGGGGGGVKGDTRRKVPKQ